MKKYDKILFLDFDGTITAEETLDGVMRRTIDPELFERKLAEMMAGKISLAEALHEGLESIPANKMDLILDYVRSVPVREGFPELLDSMKSAGIPVVVISGGLKPYIEEKLAPYKDRLLDIYSVDIDSSGDKIKLLPSHEGNGELMQKNLIMEKYDYQMAICAGDGHTDVRMALKSDLVFARDTLAGHLDKLSVPYIRWNDFNDIREYLLSKVL